VGMHVDGDILVACGVDDWVGAGGVLLKPFPEGLCHAKSMRISKSLEPCERPRTVGQ
jgi:hypothetical protein